MAQELARYQSVTHGIRVAVSPAPIFETSDPAASSYSFSYTVRIENLGSEEVQLIDRHWIIFSGGMQFAEVVGPGVVGEQPVLKPGEMFEYTSGAVIQDPLGSMQGSYTFRSSRGRFFPVEIPKFDLRYPVQLH